jgi:P pilus assembly chaperone PapD
MKLRDKVVALAVLAAILSLTGAEWANASPDPFSITLSPARVEVVAGQGKTTRILHVSNSGSTPLHVNVSIVEFSQTKNGEAVLSSPGPFSAVRWMHVRPLAIDLAPGEQRPVKVGIRIPLGAEPGERQVAVLFSVPPVPGKKNVAVSGSVASEFLIEPPGRRTERIALGPLHLP